LCIPFSFVARSTQCQSGTEAVKGQLTKELAARGTSLRPASSPHGVDPSELLPAGVR
jgi:hypothetical protein